jgi:hypothetical protein
LRNAWGNGSSQGAPRVPRHLRAVMIEAEDRVVFQISIAPASRGFSVVEVE